MNEVERLTREANDLHVQWGVLKPLLTHEIRYTTADLERWTAAVHELIAEDRDVDYVLGKWSEFVGLFAADNKLAPTLKAEPAGRKKKRRSRTK
jgi:hypothetical protein